MGRMIYAVAFATFGFVAGFVLHNNKLSQQIPANLKHPINQEILQNTCNGQILGPESFTEDSESAVYTGTWDGRIVKIQANGCEEVITLGKNTEECMEGRMGCSRPLGLRFSPNNSQELYICDAWKGLLVLNVATKALRVLADINSPEKIQFANSLIFDRSGATLYFTDSSEKETIQRALLIPFEDQPTGRLLSYDMNSGKITTLLEGLSFPNGLALGDDGHSILVAESATSSILRYFIEGPKKGSDEVFFNKLPIIPDNMQRSPDGKLLFVGSFGERGFIVKFLASHFVLRSIVRSIPWVVVEKLFSMVSSPFPVFVIDNSGELVKVYEDMDGAALFAAEGFMSSRNDLYIGFFSPRPAKVIRAEHLQ